MSGNSGKVFARKSYRLKGYDYCEVGAYFITICTQNMKCLFGKIFDGEMKLNRLGKIVRRELLALHLTYPNLEIFEDEFIIMPDHIHAILWITDVGASHRLARKPSPGPAPQSLGSIIGQYKSRCTKRINHMRETPGEPIWQRNYYDRIIRNEKELQAIKNYITQNPLRWEEDHGKGVQKFI